MINKNNQLMPIIGPILRLLHSRKFMVVLMTLVVDIVIAYVPAFESVEESLLAVFTVIGTALVASIAYEDAGRAKETVQ
ncbi:MAG: hypothetical protein JXJ17_17055 [Anaerolineae bacterium]|nr:hypothetical protein [Anaerolineae bacterium]